MKKTIPVLLGLSLGLVGCGGGGGGGGTTDPTASINNDVTYSGVTTEVAIEDQASADALIGTAYSSDSVLDEMPAFDEFMPMKPGQEASGTFDALGLYNGLKDRFGTEISAGGDPILVGVTDSGTEACDYGGSVSGTVKYASQDTVTAGDSIDITFSSCGMSPYATWNGRMFMYVRSVSGNPDDYYSESSFEVSLAFVDLHMIDTYSGEVFLDGAMTVGEKQVPSTDTSAHWLKGDRFLIEVSSGSAQTAVLMSNFDISERSEYDEILGYITTSDINYSIASTELGGTIKIDTIVPFKATWSNPYEGEMVITGAGGAHVKLAVIDDTSFEVKYDLNGNNVYGLEDPTDPEPRVDVWANL